MTTPGMTARAVMEAAASAALARYLEATGQRHDTIAERAYRDHILKAWDRTQGRAAEQAHLEQLLEADKDARRHRQAIDDELSAMTVRKLRETAAAR